MSLRAMGRFIGTRFIRAIRTKRGNALEGCDLFESLRADSKVPLYRHLIGRGECGEQQQYGPQGPFQSAKVIPMIYKDY